MLICFSSRAPPGLIASLLPIAHGLGLSSPNVTLIACVYRLNVIHEGPLDMSAHVTDAIVADRFVAEPASCPLTLLITGWKLSTTFRAFQIPSRLLIGGPHFSISVRNHTSRGKLPTAFVRSAAVNIPIGLPSWMMTSLLTLRSVMIRAACFTSVVGVAVTNGDEA